MPSSFRATAVKFFVRPVTRLGVEASTSACARAVPGAPAAPVAPCSPAGPCGPSAPRSPLSAATVFRERSAVRTERLMICAEPTLFLGIASAARKPQWSRSFEPSEDPRAEGARDQLDRELARLVRDVEHRVHLDHVER